MEGRDASGDKPYQAMHLCPMEVHYLRRNGLGSSLAQTGGHQLRMLSRGSGRGEKVVAHRVLGITAGLFAVDVMYIIADASREAAHKCGCQIIRRCFY